MDFVVHPEKESQSARDEDEEVVVEKKTLCSAAAFTRLSVAAPLSLYYSHHWLW